MLHHFTLVLDGISTLTDDIEYRLYECGCNDGTPVSRDGIVHISFSREDESREEAIHSAIWDVKRAGYPSHLDKDD